MKTEHLIIAGLLIIIVMGGILWYNQATPMNTNNGNNPSLNNPRGGDRGGTTTPPIDAGPGPVLEDWPPVPAGTTYQYGAKFEPPVGRILHGIGQWDDYNPQYLNLLSDDTLPASELMFVQIGDSPRPWDAAKIKENVMKIGASGQIPHLNISLQGNQLTQAEIAASGDPYYGIDNDVANGTKYDSRINDLIKIVKDYKKPFMVRIGGEFSGWWNGYEPYEYPKAYRKIVKMFRDAGVDNAAFIWCYEPAAPADFMEKNAAGEYKWFPGDDVIDWYSVDVFGNNDISGPEKNASGQLTAYGRTKAFLDLAEEHSKPVIIGESSPAYVSITSSEADGKADWDAWFVPYLKLMQDYPGIKWFHLINYDWSKAGYYSATGWKNADISINSYISNQWASQMEQPTFLHSNERYLLKDYLEYK